MNEKATAAPEQAGVQAGETVATPSASQVADYLATHPEFFLQHEELLTDLSLPHDSGGAVSLLERQVDFLRRRFDSSSRTVGELLENGRRSEQLFAITKELVLALLETRNARQVTTTAKTHLLARTGVETIEFIFLDDHAPLPEGEFRVEDGALMREEFKDVFRLNKAHCGPQSEGRIGWLFPDTGIDVQSTALCPLTAKGKPLALLALGHGSAEYFTVHMETMFIDFIAEATGAMLALCLESATAGN